jgi:hypothetical protein
MFKSGFAQLLPVSLAVIGAATLSAQTNLLTNGDFENRFAIQTVQTQTCGGQSSATNWATWIQGPCTVPSGLELETDLLLGSTSPFFTLNAHLIHIRAEPMVPPLVGDPGNSGITQVFDPSGLHTRVVISVWVYVVRGQAGIGAGPISGFPLTIHNSTQGAWNQLVGVSTAGPLNQFDIYSTDSTGSEFYAANAIACPADTAAELAACLVFVGAPNSGQTGTITSLTIVPSTVTGGQGAVGTLTLSAPAPAGGVTATLSSNNPAAGVPPSVTVPGGQSSGSFPITTTPVTSTTVATITATSANTVSAQLTINPPAGSGGSGGSGGQPTAASCPGSLILSAGSIIGGNSLFGTVTLNSAAKVGGQLVNLGSSSLAASVPASVMIEPGQMGTTFAITTSPVAVLQTPIISAAVGACVAVSGTLSVTPPLGISLTTTPVVSTPPLPTLPISIPPLL